MLIWQLSAAAWPTLSAQLELAAGPWPESVALLDLDWHRAELEAGRLSRLPGRATFATRWGWTEHAARTFLEASRDRRSPALHQLEDVPVRQDPPGTVIGEAGTTSSATRSPSQALEERGRVAELTSPTPGSHQAQAVPASQDQPGTVIGDPGTTSSATNSRAPSPPHTPPDLSILETSTTDQDEQIGGGPGGGPDLALVPQGLRAQAELPEVRAFLQVFLRWRGNPKAPQRWTTGTSEALSWFLELLAADPTTELGKAVAEVDLVGALQAWDAWLSDRADEHGKPGTKGRAKFPRGWKNALRRWVVNQRKYGRNLKIKASGRRRGAWAGTATAFTAPTPAQGPDQAPGSPSNPCTPPGDPDALERF